MSASKELQWQRVYDEYILNEGDCIYIDANTDHSYHKLGDEECVSVWVYASPHATPMADSFVL